MDRATWLNTNHADSMVEYVLRSASVISKGEPWMPMHGTPRKLRLIALAACREAWWPGFPPDARHVLFLAHKYAQDDNEKSRGQILIKAQRLVHKARSDAERTGNGVDIRYLDAVSGTVVIDDDLPTSIRRTLALAARLKTSPGLANTTYLCPWQADLIRTIIGDPWEDIPWPSRLCWTCRGYGTTLGAGPDRGNPECGTCNGNGRVKQPWLTPDAVRIAQGVYRDCLLRRGSIEGNGYLDRAMLGVLADALEEAGCPDQRVLDHLRGTRRTVPQMVKAGSNCPVCGSFRTWFRSGVHFDHMKKCKDCDAASWVPDEEYTIPARTIEIAYHVTGDWVVDRLLSEEYQPDV